MPKEVAAPLVTGMFAVIVAVVGLAGGRFVAQRKDREQRVRESKIPIYEEFIGTFFGQFTQGEKPSAEDTAEAMRRHALSLTVWRSDAVISEWGRYRRRVASGDLGSGSPELLFDFERLLRIMRSEFGHDDRKLSKGDLLGLFVTDIDQYL